MAPLRRYLRFYLWLCLKRRGCVAAAAAALRSVVHEVLRFGQSSAAATAGWEEKKKHLVY